METDLQYLTVSASESRKLPYSSLPTSLTGKSQPSQWLFALITFVAVMFAASGPAMGQGLAGLLGGDENEILSPDEAFKLDIVANDDNSANATFVIEEGYFLYRPKFIFSLPEEPDVQIEVANLSPGKLKHDEFFGDVHVNRDLATADLKFLHQGEARDVSLSVTYQGCADIGICYPPQTQNFELTLAAASNDVMATVIGASDGGSSGGGSTVQADVASTVTSLANSSDAGADVVANKDTSAITAQTAQTNVQTLGQSEQDRLATRLGESSLLVIIALFIGFGVLLAFTPCVLPMVPILSGLIVGQGEKITTLRATMLSIVYVLVMATTYAIAGILVAKTGAGIGFLQNPWILTGFAALLAVLSLSMFGFYELQMPVGLQNRLNNISNSQGGGNFAGVAVMGFLSALIVGPCVTAPLVGALIFIADTGNTLVGGTALFSLGIGMGIPLILVGASCGKWLPRAGVWMERVKAVFGVMLLGMAIWMLSRFLPPTATMALAAALVIVSGIYLGALDVLQTDSSGWQRLAKGTGVIALVYGASLLVGALAGGHSLLTPLRGITAGGGNATTTGQVANATHAEAEFVAVKSLDDLDGFLQTAASNNQPLILDFYADWCVSCKEMEAFTFTDEAVKGEMSKAILLRADVTKNDKIDKALLKKFSLFGPPAILFFPPGGAELRNGRVVGFMNKTEFHGHLLNVYGSMGLPTRTASVDL